jgi:hypothetical protein
MLEQQVLQAQQGQLETLAPRGQQAQQAQPGYSAEPQHNKLLQPTILKIIH